MLRRFVCTLLVLHCWCTMTADAHGHAGLTATRMHRDDCDSNPCRFNQHCEPRGGSAAAAGDGYACACEPGFSGVTCEVYTDMCLGSQCSPNSTCNPPSGMCVCDSPAFQGRYCNETLSDVCATHEPCSPLATCTNTGGYGYQCSCALGTFGGNCFESRNDCGNDCGGDSGCVDRLNSFGMGTSGYANRNSTCDCVGTGFEGDFCGSVENQCTSAVACPGTSTCDSQLNGYNCTGGTQHSVGPPACHAHSKVAMRLTTRSVSANRKNVTAYSWGLGNDRGMLFHTIQVPADAGIVVELSSPLHDCIRDYHLVRMPVAHRAWQRHVDDSATLGSLSQTGGPDLPALEVRQGGAGAVSLVVGAYQLQNNASYSFKYTVYAGLVDGTWTWEGTHAFTLHKAAANVPKILSAVATPGRIAVHFAPGDAQRLLRPMQTGPANASCEGLVGKHTLGLLHFPIPGPQCVWVRNNVLHIVIDAMKTAGMPRQGDMVRVGNQEVALALDTAAFLPPLRIRGSAFLLDVEDLEVDARVPQLGMLDPVYHNVSFELQNAGAFAAPFAWAIANHSNSSNVLRVDRDMLPRGRVFIIRIKRFSTLLPGEVVEDVLWKVETAAAGVTYNVSVAAYESYVQIGRDLSRPTTDIVFDMRAVGWDAMHSDIVWYGQSGVLLSGRIFKRVEQDGRVFDPYKITVRVEPSYMKQQEEVHSFHAVVDGVVSPVYNLTLRRGRPFDYSVYVPVESAVWSDDYSSIVVTFPRTVPKADVRTSCEQLLTVSSRVSLGLTSEDCAWDPSGASLTLRVRAAIPVHSLGKGAYIVQFLTGSGISNGIYHPVLLSDSIDELTSVAPQMMIVGDKEFCGGNLTYDLVGIEARVTHVKWVASSSNATLASFFNARLMDAQNSTRAHLDVAGFWGLLKNESLTLTATAYDWAANSHASTSTDILLPINGTDSMRPRIALSEPNVVSVSLDQRMEITASVRMPCGSWWDSLPNAQAQNGSANSEAFIGGWALVWTSASNAHMSAVQTNINRLNHLTATLSLRALRLNASVEYLFRYSASLTHGASNAYSAWEDILVRVDGLSANERLPVAAPEAYVNDAYVKQWPTANFDIDYARNHAAYVWGCHMGRAGVGAPCFAPTEWNSAVRTADGGKRLRVGKHVLLALLARLLPGQRIHFSVRVPVGDSGAGWSAPVPVLSVARTANFTTPLFVQRGMQTEDAEAESAWFLSAEYDGRDSSAMGAEHAGFAWACVARNTDGSASSCEASQVHVRAENKAQVIRVPVGATSVPREVSIIIRGQVAMVVDVPVIPGTESLALSGVELDVARSIENGFGAPGVRLSVKGLVGSRWRYQFALYHSSDTATRALGFRAHWQSQPFLHSVYYCGVENAAVFVKDALSGAIVYQQEVSLVNFTCQDPLAHPLNAGLSMYGSAQQVQQALYTRVALNVQRTRTLAFVKAVGGGKVDALTRDTYLSVLGALFSEKHFAAYGRQGRPFVRSHINDAVSAIDALLPHGLHPSIGALSSSTAENVLSGFASLKQSASDSGFNSSEVNLINVLEGVSRRLTVGLLVDKHFAPVFAGGASMLLVAQRASKYGVWTAGVSTHHPQAGSLTDLLSAQIPLAPSGDLELRHERSLNVGVLFNLDVAWHNRVEMVPERNIIVNGTDGFSKTFQLPCDAPKISLIVQRDDGVDMLAAVDTLVRLTFRRPAWPDNTGPIKSPANRTSSSWACRYWDSAKQGFSSEGCAVHPNVPAEEFVCHCHTSVRKKTDSRTTYSLGVFVTDMVDDPTEPSVPLPTLVSTADLLNAFNFENLKRNPTPLIVTTCFCVFFFVIVGALHYTQRAEKAKKLAAFDRAKVFRALNIAYMKRESVKRMPCGRRIAASFRQSMKERHVWLSIFSYPGDRWVTFDATQRVAVAYIGFLAGAVGSAMYFGNDNATTVWGLFFATMISALVAVPAVLILSNLFSRCDPCYEVYMAEWVLTIHPQRRTVSFAFPVEQRLGCTSSHGNSLLSEGQKAAITSSPPQSGKWVERGSEIVFVQEEALGTSNSGAVKQGEDGEQLPVIQAPAQEEKQVAITIHQDISAVDTTSSVIPGAVYTGALQVLELDARRFSSSSEEEGFLPPLAAPPAAPAAAAYATDEKDKAQTGNGRKIFSKKDKKHGCCSRYRFCGRAIYVCCRKPIPTRTGTFVVWAICVFAVLLFSTLILLYATKFDLPQTDTSFYVDADDAASRGFQAMGSFSPDSLTFAKVDRPANVTTSTNDGSEDGGLTRSGSWLLASTLGFVQDGLVLQPLAIGLTLVLTVALGPLLGPLFNKISKCVGTNV